MGEEQTATKPAPAAAQPTSLSELNHQHQSSRTALLSSAIQKALTSKATAEPGKARTLAPGSVKPTAPVVATPADSTPAPAAAEPGTLESEPSAEPAPGPDASDPEPETAALAPEIAKLQELGKKKDLRALEKELGLEEGSLGVHNGSWAAYRRRIEEADARDATHERNQSVLVERFGPPAALIEQANKGNLKAYAALIEQTTGVPIARFVEHWSKNVEQLDPETVRLQRENEQLRRQTRAPEPAPAKPDAAAAAAKADAYIQEEAGKHPAFKLEGAKEGIRAIWLKSWNPQTKGFGLTPQQAAAEFIKVRRAAYEREQWIVSGKAPPATKPKTRALSRNGSAETQVRKDGRSRQQIIEDAARDWQRLKAREAAGVR